MCCAKGARDALTPNLFPRQTFSQLRRFGKAAVPVRLPLARGFLITRVLGTKLTGGDHVMIGADLARTAGLDTWLH